MDKLKQWIALTVVGCLAVLAGGWFLLVAPQRAEAQALREQAAAQEVTNAATRTKLTVLKSQAKDLPKKQAELAAVAAKIPRGPELPALIRALDDVSADAGVDLQTIAPGEPVAVAATADAAPAGAAAAGTATTPPGLARIPLLITVGGGYFQVQQFLSGLEGLDRAVRVTALGLVPATDSSTGSGASGSAGRLRASITGEVYLSGAGAPAGAAAVAGAASGGTTPAAAPGSPAATTAGTPSSTSVPTPSAAVERGASTPSSPASGDAQPTAQ